ncbi:MAG: hypothetical protein EOM25_06250 [Deltaproteobacteria bacterium]|nr:hypothetical protein [Deltaproteobacteria bacterium]
MNVKHLFFVPLLMLVMACATTSSGTQVQSSSQPPSQPVAGTPVEQGRDNAPTAYFDFDDVLIPTEMSIVPKTSLLIETPHVKAGVVNFEGRVEPISLFNFFVVNMPKDGWQLRSYIKYGRYILVFEKTDRDCIITINESALKTSMEVWITPRIADKMGRQTPEVTNMGTALAQ